MRNFILIALLCLSAPAFAAPCKTGCAVAKHGEGPLEPDELVGWIQAYQDSDIDSASIALETLLYHGDQVRDYLSEYTNTPLDGEHRKNLQNQLSKQFAIVEARLVNDRGVVVAHLEPAEVKIGEKVHLNVPGRGERLPFEISGTVMRVGVKHLWARL